MEPELRKYNIEAVHPDDFIVNLIDLDDRKAKRAIDEMVLRRVNPPVELSEPINRIEKGSLPKSAKRFREVLDI